jgi:cytoskeletal protein CcmA (bactofilin family)
MVWKKSDDPPTHHPEPTPTPQRPIATAPSAPAPLNQEPPRRSSTGATIGPSIFIKGDLSGEEDLVIEGRVEGKVDLKQNNVTVGKNGRVRADVFGKVVIIEGEVDGNVFAREQAILRQEGAIRGNITAPRVVLEDGSRFKGSIDMEVPKEMGGPSRTPEPSRTEAPPAPAGTAQAAGAAGVKATA